MAQQALAGGFVIGAHTVGIGPGANGIGSGTGPGVLNCASAQGDQVVAAAAEKAPGHLAVGIADGELSLVAVAFGFGGAGDARFGQVKAANAAHGIPHAALLLPQFFFVGNMAELAASALGEGGAIGSNAVGRGLQQFFQTAEGIVFQYLYQADAANIPPSGAGDKDGHAVDMGNAGTLGGIALNGGGMNLIFHQRHRRTPLHRNRGDPNGPPGIG